MLGSLYFGQAYFGNVVDWDGNDPGAYLAGTLTSVSLQVVLSTVSLIKRNTTVQTV